MRYFLLGLVIGGFVFVNHSKASAPYHDYVLFSQDGDDKQIQVLVCNSPHGALNCHMDSDGTLWMDAEGPSVRDIDYLQKQITELKSQIEKKGK